MVLVGLWSQTWTQTDQSHHAHQLACFNRAASTVLFRRYGQRPAPREAVTSKPDPG
jgi:hypothetical protein